MYLGEQCSLYNFRNSGLLKVIVFLQGVKVASTALRERIDVVRKKVKSETGKDPTWLELIKKCHAVDVDLCERYW